MAHQSVADKNVTHTFAVYLTAPAIREDADGREDGWTRADLEDLLKDSLRSMQRVVQRQGVVVDWEWQTSEAVPS